MKPIIWLCADAVGVGFEVADEGSDLTAAGYGCVGSTRRALEGVRECSRRRETLGAIQAQRAHADFLDRRRHVRVVPAGWFSSPCEDHVQHRAFTGSAK